MVRRTAVVLALALGVPLAACQPAEQQAGGGAGGERTMTVGADTPGAKFEDAYTNLAEVHINLVQGDWDQAAENMREVRENLGAMKQAEGEPLSTAAATRVDELQRAANNLDQLIATRSPDALSESRTLMNAFTRESTLAQEGMTGGGAGTAPQP